MRSIVLNCLMNVMIRTNRRLILYIYSDSRVGTPRRNGSGMRISESPGKSSFHGAVIPTPGSRDRFDEWSHRLTKPFEELPRKPAIERHVMELRYWPSHAKIKGPDMHHGNEDEDKEEAEAEDAEAVESGPFGGDSK
jgi:hypothetical protein